MSIEVDHDENLQLIERANNFCRNVFTADRIESSWVGFRYITKDRVPVVGPVPDFNFLVDEYSDIAKGRKNRVYATSRPLKNLYVSAAHASRGFTTSFLCAEVIASQITGEPIPVSKRVLDYLNPSRFFIDELKRR
jgi:tRNA 5-methylaminomethyl-2-thiouridine biosynthesis bifunctional protein